MRRLFCSVALAFDHKPPDAETAPEPKTDPDREDEQRWADEQRVLTKNGGTNHAQNAPGRALGCFGSGGRAAVDHGEGEIVGPASARAGMEPLGGVAIVLGAALLSCYDGGANNKICVANAAAVAAWKKMAARATLRIIRASTLPQDAHLKAELVPKLFKLENFRGY